MNRIENLEFDEINRRVREIVDQDPQLRDRLIQLALDRIKSSTTVKSRPGISFDEEHWESELDELAKDIFNDYFGE